jgi:hypothetical protein
MASAKSDERMSGRAKTQVERCPCLDTKTFREQLRRLSGGGAINWRTISGMVAWLKYSIGRDEAGPLFLAEFSTSGVGGQLDRQQIRLVGTLCLGRARWWFRCALCYRRCRCLYLIPDDPHEFKCRTCGDLQYRSCQESHTQAGILRQIERRRLQRATELCERLRQRRSRHGRGTRRHARAASGCTSKVA